MSHCSMDINLDKLCYLHLSHSTLIATQRAAKFEVLRMYKCPKLFCSASALLKHSNPLVAFQTEDQARRTQEKIATSEVTFGLFSDWLHTDSAHF